jgi:hypothetical protein
MIISQGKRDYGDRVRVRFSMLFGKKVGYRLSSLCHAYVAQSTHY